MRGVPDARDEYDSYLGRLAERLRRNCGADDVADLLAEMESESMGVSATGGDLVPTARLLVDWYRDEIGGATKVG